MIPIAELRTLVGLAAGDDSQDATLLSLEAFAVAQISLTSGAYLADQGSITRRIIGGGTDSLRLPASPVGAVTLVEESYLTDAVPSPVEITDYVVRSPKLIRTGGAVWVSGAEYAVTYVAGYAAGQFPPIYYQTAKDIVALMYADAQATAASGGAASPFMSKESLGDYSYELDTSAVGAGASGTVSDSVAAILARLPKRLRT